MIFLERVRLYLIETNEIKDKFMLNHIGMILEKKKRR